MNRSVDLIIEGLNHKDDPTYEEFEVWEEVDVDEKVAKVKLSGSGRQVKYGTDKEAAKEFKKANKKETKKTMKKSGYKCVFGRYYKDGKEISKEEYDKARSEVSSSIKSVKAGKKTISSHNRRYAVKG